MPDFPEISDHDIVVPLAIIALCLFLMLVVWFFTRRRFRDAKLSPALTAQQPIIGQATVTAAQLGAWHRLHGSAVQAWVENHEQLLKRVSDDGLSIDLSDDLTAEYNELEPAIEEAIVKHPAPQMRAQLSALVLASRNTIEALRRSNWSAAEREHLTYLEYRDTWLDRLRQFATAESQVRELRSIGSDSIAPGWIDREHHPPG